jgi:hypothetical protein
MVTTLHALQAQDKPSRRIPQVVDPEPDQLRIVPEPPQDLVALAIEQTPDTLPTTGPPTDLTGMIMIDGCPDVYTDPPSAPRTPSTLESQDGLVVLIGDPVGGLCPLGSLGRLDQLPPSVMMPVAPWPRMGSREVVDTPALQQTVLADLDLADLTTTAPHSPGLG